MKYNELIKNKSLDIKPQAFFSREEFRNFADELYLDFMKENNGGYFYHNSLLLFGSTSEENQFNIIHINNLFKKYYKNIVDDLFFFGQDIFGNGFAFENENIILFNIESGQKEILANSFDGWLDVLYEDLDYYTGESLVYELNHSEREELTKEKRLCPKYPFILGGEYNIDNLVLKGYIENISYNADIAKQVYNLPEGSKIKIVINNE